MKTLCKDFKVVNPVTGEVFTQSRRSPRVYVDLELDKVDAPTQQQFKNECDINFIVKNYQLPKPDYSTWNTGDFSDAPTYLEAMNTIAHANQQFLLLPAKIRARFENEPAKMLAFVNDPENAQELIKLGLATKPIPIEPNETTQAINKLTDLLKPSSDESSNLKAGSKPTK